VYCVGPIEEVQSRGFLPGCISKEANSRGCNPEGPLQIQIRSSPPGVPMRTSKPGSSVCPLYCDLSRGSSKMVPTHGSSQWGPLKVFRSMVTLHVFACRGSPSGPHSRGPPKVGLLQGVPSEGSLPWVPSSDSPPGRPHQIAPSKGSLLGGILVGPIGEVQSRVPHQGGKLQACNPERPLQGIQHRVPPPGVPLQGFSMSILLGSLPLFPYKGSTPR
jgi:hypothetical protein